MDEDVLGIGLLFIAGLLVMFLILFGATRGNDTQRKYEIACETQHGVIIDGKCVQEVEVKL